MMTDPISDMLTRLRNGSSVKKKEVLVPFSTIKFSLAKILEREGYVTKVERSSDDKGRQFKIQLKYENGVPAIHHIVRVSKPGQRVYSGWKEIRAPKVGLGISVVSTSQGLMTGSGARRRKLGGEVLCSIS